ILDEARRCIPSIVIRDLRGAQGDVAVHHTQQETRERAAAGAARSAGGIGLDVRECILAAQSRKERYDILQRVRNVDTKLEAHGAYVLIQNVGDRIPLLAILYLCRSAAAKSGRRRSASA